MKKENVKKGLKAGIPVSLIGIGIVCVISVSLILSNTGNVAVEQIIPPEENTVIEEPIEQRYWQPLPMGDADPGAGNSGTLRVYVVLTGQTYTSNLTSDAGYVLAYGDTNNAVLSENGTNVNYSTAFDIVELVRYNKTDAYNSSNSTWNLDWVKANITLKGALSVTNTSMTEYNISGCTTAQYIYVHYVYANQQIGRGDSVDECRFYHEAYKS